MEVDIYPVTKEVHSSTLDVSSPELRALNENATMANKKVNLVKRITITGSGEE